MPLATLLSTHKYTDAYARLLRHFFFRRNLHVCLESHVEHVRDTDMEMFVCVWLLNICFLNYIIT